MFQRHGSRIAPAAATASLASAAGLWTLGLVTTPPPWLLRGILAAALGAGVAAIAAVGAPPRARRFGRLAGTAGLAAAALFLGALFHKPDGPAEVVRRVSSPPSAGSLRLLSFNVLHGYPPSRDPDPERRAAVLTAALRALDPAVVVLQEAWRFTGRTGLAERLGRELGYDVAYAAANGSQRLIGFEEGSAVLSRLPIVDARRIELEPRKAPWEVRIALIVTVEPAAGERLTVVGTHLANGAPRVAAAQARSLAARLPGEGPVWVAGDLNAPSESAAVRALVAAGLVDVLPGGIDHVLVSGPGRAPGAGGWTVRDARWALRPRDLLALLGEETRISDHPAILVDFLRRPPPRPPPRLPDPGE